MKMMCNCWTMGGVFKKLSEMLMATIEQLEARCLLSARMGPEIFVQSVVAAPGHIDARQFASDNKLVMAYRTGDFLHPDSAEEFVTMMNPDGTMDQAFGGGVDTGLSAAQTIRVQSDGKIIIVGSIQ